MAFVGIDVGGTRIKLGLVKQKKMVSSSVFEVKNNHSLEANLPLIIEEIKALSFAFDASEPIEGIGMALPCLIDHKKNKILSDYRSRYPQSLPYCSANTKNMPKVFFSIRKAMN